MTSRPLMCWASFSAPLPIFLAAMRTPSASVLPMPWRFPIFSMSWMSASGLPKLASIPSRSFLVSMPFS